MECIKVVCNEDNHIMVLEFPKNSEVTSLYLSLLCRRSSRLFCKMNQTFPTRTELVKSSSSGSISQSHLLGRGGGTGLGSK